MGRKKRKRTENAENLPVARSSPRSATRSASRLSIANQTEQVTLCAKVKKHFSELLGHILEKSDQNRIASIVSGSSKIEERDLRVRLTAHKTVIGLHEKLLTDDFPFDDFFDETGLVQLEDIIQLSRAHLVSK